MKRSYLIFAVTLAVAVFVSFGWPQHGSAAGPYKITKTAKVGGDGGFDYVYADVAERRLYVPRSGPTAGSLCRKTWLSAQAS